jgi:hypothetical protein
MKRVPHPFRVFCGMGGKAQTSTRLQIELHRNPHGKLQSLLMGTWIFNYDAVDRLTSATPGSDVPTEYRRVAHP